MKLYPYEPMITTNGNRPVPHAIVCWYAPDDPGRTTPLEVFDMDGNAVGQYVEADQRGYVVSEVGYQLTVTSGYAKSEGLPTVPVFSAPHLVARADAAASAAADSAQAAAVAEEAAGVSAAEAKQAKVSAQEAVAAATAPTDDAVSAAVLNRATKTAGAITSLIGTETAGVRSDVARLNKASYGWLIAGFLDNGEHGEKLSLFYSPDGKTIFGGQQNPVYGTDRLRDPSIIYYNGAFYVGYTLADGVGRNFRIITSETGAVGTWTVAATVDVSGLVPAGDKCWAPELVADGEDVYAFFTWQKAKTSETTAGSGNGSLSSMGWVKAITPGNGLKTWSAPTALSTNGFSNAYIDGVPIKHGPDWYFFSSGGSQIYRAKSTTGITGPYTQDRSGDWAGWGAGIEGPYITKIGDIYRIYYDRYVAGLGHWFSESTDLNTWSTPRPVQPATGTMPKGGKLRHGSFLQLPGMDAAGKAMAATMSPAAPAMSTMRHGKVIPNGSVVSMDGVIIDSDPTSLLRNPDSAGSVYVAQGGTFLLTADVTITGPAATAARTFVQYDDGAGAVYARFPLNSPGEDRYTASAPVALPMNGRLRAQAFHTQGGDKAFVITTKLTRLGVSQ